METDGGIESDSIKSRSDINEESWYQKYATTALILALIHILFIHHVAKRRTRSSMVVSYDILVQKKQYHRALLALLSHPPTKRSQHRDSQSSIEVAYFSSLIERIQEWRWSSVLRNGKRLSGMPLLLYNSFIFWNCRELEPMMGSTEYVRFLWGIALVAILLEILFTYCIQSFLRDMNYGSSPPMSVTSNRGQQSPGVQQVKRMLVHRSMGR